MTKDYFIEMAEYNVWANNMFHRGSKKLNFKQFIESMPERKIERKFLFKNTKGVEYTQPYYQLLAHIINHSKLSPGIG